jgi:Tfp pilus assembly protein PilF
MRQPPRILKSVDIELPLARPACAPRAATARPRPAPGRGGSFARKAVAGAILVAAAGCATQDASPARQFRIEPVFSVSPSPESAASSQAYYKLGKYFDDLHEWGRAIDAYRQAVSADTRSVEAVNALGVALAQARRFAEAEATLRQAVVLAPEHAHVRNNLGYVLLLEGRPQDAMAQLKLAVSRDATSAVAVANLRDAMARSGVQAGAADAIVATLAADGAKPTATTFAGAAPADGAAKPVQAPAGDTRSDVPVDTLAPTRQDSAAPAAPLATGAGADDVLRSSRLEVSNGNGMHGMAARVGLWLAARGVPAPRLTNQQPYAQRQTVIQFRSGHEDAARRLASLLPAGAQTAPRASPDLRSDVRVVLGRDWLQIADCLARTSCQPASTATASTPPIAGTIIARQ